MVSLSTAAMIAAVAFLLGMAVGRRSSKGRTVVWREEPKAGTSLQPEIVDPEIDDLLRRDQLIAAIKRYRELSGMGLKESKDAMEARRRELR